MKRWLARHERFHFHFTPTSSSWLNMMERGFGEISQKRIRPGSFESVSQLIAAIENYLAHYNEAPKRFVCTKDADMTSRRSLAVKKRYLHHTSVSP